MKNLPVLIGASVCFGIPVLIATAMNWEQIQPYIVVDPATAEGYVLYLYAPS